MSSIEDFRRDMPAMLDHEGVWQGVYTHINRDAEIIDKHNVRIICEFPTSGDFVYIQHNHFTWDDGREFKMDLPGRYRDGRLWWDLETFSGSAWQTKTTLSFLTLTAKMTRVQISLKSSPWAARASTALAHGTGLKTDSFSNVHYVMNGRFPKR